MANYIARPVVEVPDYLVGTIYVPTGVTLYAGNLIVAESLSSAISGNWTVYDPAQPATATLGKQMAIVINDGFEKLSDGRRPEGNPDYTKYSFTEGDVVTIIFLTPQMRFEIGYDAITGTPAAGGVLYPTNGAYGLTYHASTVPSGTYSSFKILALTNFRIGGKFGAQFAKTVQVKVQLPTA